MLLQEYEVDTEAKVKRCSLTVYTIVRAQFSDSFGFWLENMGLTFSFDCI